MMAGGEAPEDPDRYQRIKEAARARNAETSAAGRDIGDLPPVVKPKRKARAERDFRRFCESYFPLTFSLGWSADHLKVIGRIETAVLDGGLFALAMPRGSGKTTLCECAGLWAIVYGHRRFVVPIGASEAAGTEILDSLRTELEVNELLLEDFPEVCYPIVRLEGIANRCKGQLFKGERTRITWTDRELVLPTIPESKASGAVIRVAGITGRIRGLKHKTPEGVSLRPDLVIVDDPQTDESARSATQCEQRERILAGAVLGLAGPGSKISGIMPCTVIQRGDMADSILDRMKHPEWNGERTKMVYTFPTRTDLWGQYAELRAEGLRAGDAGAAATRFYRKHRKEMDAGAVVAWPARHNPDELSGLQHAMNLKIQNEAAFAAECQNEPLVEAATQGELTADEIAGKLNRRERGSIPIGAQLITAMIDVHEAALYWLVAAWEHDFTGAVIDYGTFPDQRIGYFSLRDLRFPLAKAVKASGLEGQLRAGLELLTSSILARSYSREDGAGLRVERCLIDANWGASTDVVYEFCRASPFAGVVVPSHGRYVGASSQPFTEYRRKPGDRVGHNWRMPNVAGKRAVRHVVFDANYWKSFVHSRLAVAMGDRGGLSLFGSRPADHRLLAEHLTSEYRVRTSGRGREVDEWRIRPERSDNHWLDCLAGAAVAASMQGAILAGTGGASPAAGRGARVSFAEIQRRKRG